VLLQRGLFLWHMVMMVAVLNGYRHPAADYLALNPLAAGIHWDLIFQRAGVDLWLNMLLSAVFETVPRCWMPPQVPMSVILTVTVSLKLSFKLLIMGWTYSLYQGPESIVHYGKRHGVVH